MTNVHNIPSEQLTRHRQPLDALTGIRFFAASYVVLYHSKLSQALASHHLIAASNFIKSGSIAVSLFFLLSGFILAYTYSGRIRTSAERRRFWEARFARLYPVYLLSLLVTSLVHVSAPKWSYALATLLMVQAWNPFDPGMWGAWNYVCWTLSVEAFFYLVFPWYQRPLERLGMRWIVLITLGMLVLAMLLNSGVRVIGYPTWGVLSHIPLPVLRLPEFLAGAGIGTAFLRMERGVATLLFGAEWGVLTYSSVLLSIGLLCRAQNSTTSVVLVGFSALILGLATEATLLSRFLSTRAIVFGGAISYGVYVLQVAAKDLTISVANYRHLNSAGLRFLLLVTILLCSSALSYLMVEIPGRERLRSLFSKLEVICSAQKAEPNLRPRLD